MPNVTALAVTRAITCSLACLARLGIAPVYRLELFPEFSLFFSSPISLVFSGLSANTITLFLRPLCGAVTPLVVWKSLETQLLSLNTIARNIFCIPLAGVSVERVFNFARDMCCRGYRRGHLTKVMCKYNS